MEKHWALNIAALMATLALGVAAWWLTHDATPQRLVNLAGAIVLWVVLQLIVVVLSGQLAKALRGEA